MLLQDALEQLKAGQKIVRKCWAESEGYLVLMPGMKNVWKILIHPAPNAGNHIFNVEELCADDWDFLGCNEAVVDVSPCDVVSEPVAA